MRELGYILEQIKSTVKRDGYAQKLKEEIEFSEVVLKIPHDKRYIDFSLEIYSRELVLERFFRGNTWENASNHFGREIFENAERLGFNAAQVLGPLPVNCLMIVLFGEDVMSIKSKYGNGGTRALHRLSFIPVIDDNGSLTFELITGEVINEYPKGTCQYQNLLGCKTVPFPNTYEELKKFIRKPNEIIEE